MSASLPLVDWPPIGQMLISDGWQTPNTYSSHFAPIEKIPAVYLFVALDRKTYQRGFIGYVGMSRNLAQRMAGHPVRSEMERLDLWVMTWFKRTDPADLRTSERALIRSFNPPWNIIGRPRGVALS